MSAQHNPGPWKVAGSVVNEISDRDGLLITKRVIGAANAHLIAAAPEMLEALKALTAGRVSPATGGRLILERDIEAAERAIAKAEGNQ
ncbi:hypothetical protein [Limimaricola cinnabarinus]|uniref:hypothetical protein n=1 Tax=Limimaricola cinnabarinus TaxID=1125964 RepID=UPI0024909F4F|nr:hypothetical protein [Limimaricola cinnabarinus]